MRPVLVDLFCGRGGWSKAAARRGWNCVGYDVEDLGYPWWLERRACPLDVAVIERHCPSLVVASPPCEDFARFHLPWLRTVSRPSTALLEWSISLRGRLSCPVVVECSLFAARHVKPQTRAGSFALWGDVPALLPEVARCKAAMSGTEPAKRAEIPEALAGWIMDYHDPRRRASLAV